MSYCIRTILFIGCVKYSAYAMEGQWYPAAEFEKPVTVKIQDILGPNYNNDTERRYLPLTILDSNPSGNNNEWNSIENPYKNTITSPSTLQTSNLLTYPYSQDSFLESTKYDVLISNVSEAIPSANSLISKTVNNVNMLKVRPKRKIIRKKCPMRPRHKKQLSRKDPRFLEVFEVVEFDHVVCVSSSGLDGICLHEYECVASGGILMGTCADGYGSCCVTQFSCDEHTSAASGWFVNPGFPSASSDRISCALTLDKASPDVIQVRLDFKSFELLPPTDGNCEQDQFIVSGQNINNLIPILCGINTGQHLYIEVGDVDGPIYLTVQTVSSDNRLFAIKVNQLTAVDQLLAPAGCLQYFTEAKVYITSFNYEDKSEIGIPRISTYLNNLNYAMCILRDPKSCSITFTNAVDMQIVNYDLDGLPTIPPGQAGVEIFNCPSDWLLISAERLCGEKLNDGSVLQDFSVDAPVTDVAAGPIVIWFRSDGSYVGRGFKLQYLQNACSIPA